MPPIIHNTYVVLAHRVWPSEMNPSPVHSIDDDDEFDYGESDKEQFLGKRQKKRSNGRRSRYEAQWVALNEESHRASAMTKTTRAAEQRRQLCTQGAKAYQLALEGRTERLLLEDRAMGKAKNGDKTGPSRAPTNYV
jgi:hypothetical protein